MRKPAYFGWLFHTMPLALMVLFMHNVALGGQIYSENQGIQCIADNFNGSYTQASFRAIFCKKCIDTVSTTCELSIENGECFYSGECREGYVNPQNENADLTCSAANYTVKYMDGGSEILPSTAYTYGIGANINAVAEKTGYTFLGWCADAGLSNCSSEQTISTTDIGDKTYYAKWNAMIYAISYRDGFSPMTGLSPTSYTILSNDITLPTPTKEGYIFNGWYENPSFVGNAVTQIASGSTANRTYYAKWTKKEFVCQTGVWLHVGDGESDKFCLYDADNKPAAPRIAIQTENGVRYMMLSRVVGNVTMPVHKGSNKKMYVEIRGKLYNVLDESSLDND